MVQQLADLTPDGGAVKALSTGMLAEAANRLQQAPRAPREQALNTLPGKLLKVLLCHKPKPGCAGSTVRTNARLTNSCVLTRSGH